MFWAGKLPGDVEQQAKLRCICLCLSLILVKEEILDCAASQAIVLMAYQIPNSTAVTPLLLLLPLLQ